MSSMFSTNKFDQMSETKLYLHERSTHEGFHNLNLWVHHGLSQGLILPCLKNQIQYAPLVLLGKPVTIAIRHTLGIHPTTTHLLVKVLAQMALNLAHLAAHSPLKANLPNKYAIMFPYG
jgi:hypothetical protein